MTAATGAERLRDGSCYFQRSRLIWMIAITFGMILLGWVTLWPSTIPYNYLGIFGTFLNYLVKNHHKWVCYGFWVSWLIHVVEALYSVKLCHDESDVYLQIPQRRHEEELARKRMQICSSVVVLSLAVGLYFCTWSPQGSLLYISRSKGITDPAVQFHWLIQTLLFGYASFGLLVSYKPSAKKQY